MNDDSRNDLSPWDIHTKKKKKKNMPRSLKEILGKDLYS